MLQTTYADLDHSGEGPAKGGKSGTSGKGRQQHHEDPVHYGKIYYDKMNAKSNQTQSAPGGSLPSPKPKNLKPPGRNPSASTKK